MNPVSKKIVFIAGAGIVVAILLLVGLTSYFRHRATAPLSQPPEHGASYVIEAEFPDANPGTNDLMGLKDVLLKRADRLGVRIFWESIAGARVRVMAATRNLGDAQQFQGVFFHTGRLEFRLVHENSDRMIETGEVPSEYEILKREESTPSGGRRIEQIVVKRQAESGLGGNLVEAAMVMRDEFGLPQICFTLRPEAAIAFAQVTRDNLDRRLAIVVDGQLYSAPVIRGPIETGSGMITGNFDLTDAFQIANVLECPLPFPVKVVEAKDY